MSRAPISPSVSMGQNHDGSTPADRRRSKRCSLSFSLLYLRAELGRRRRQASLVASGLALGVALVIMISAISSGVADAQKTILHSLYGIGTDITVTTSPTAESVAGGNRGGSASAPGDLLLGDLGLLRSASAAAISHQRGVAEVAEGLVLSELSQAQGSLPTTITVDGTDLTNLRLGPLASATIVAGRTFTPTEATANVALIDVRYAKEDDLKVGSSISIAHTSFRVIGLAEQTNGASDENIYIPLSRAQTLTSYDDLENLHGYINEIYVAADNATNVNSIDKEIANLLPRATIVSSANLADQVSGSLNTTARLAEDLGRTVAIGALAAAVAIAILLSLASVNRRIREFGTLAALGWKTDRIVRQVLGESVTIGAFGAIAGVTIGLVGLAVFDAISPTLTAVLPRAGGSGSAASIAVRLTARTTAGSALLAPGLAIGGALIAGGIGSWRAARLRPADAFVQTV